MFLLINRKTDRPASWRMPTPKQMEKLAAAAAVSGKPPPARAPGPGGEMPPEYWQAVMDDPLAEAKPRTVGSRTRLPRLSEITQHILRVSCRRCTRTVEIQKADVVRLYGAEAAWKDVGQRLLDNTCQQRTGRHEEDGCWPAFEQSPAPPISC
jgi:hypothetical protein